MRDSIKRAIEAEALPRVLFLFVSVVYLCVYSLLKATGKLSGSCVSDECGYIELSRNLLQGFYSLSGSDLNLWWGPGYPLFLAPFIAQGADRELLVLVNVVISLSTIFLLYKTALILISKWWALVVAGVWALYYLHYPSIFTALSEPLACFLILCGSYFFLRFCEERGRLSYCLIAGILLGFLILTKVIFSYVFLILLCLAFIAMVFDSLRKTSTKSILVLVIAFVVTLPYQFYTFNLTGKVFYFSNAGGSALYFMTSPYSGEFGEWNNPGFTANCGFASDVPCNAELFAKNHGEIFKQANKLPPIERDEFLKRLSIENIINSPERYFRNYLNNFSRMLFNIPNSYFYQREQTIFRLIPNSILLTFLIFSSFFTIAYPKRFSFPFLYVLSFVLTYLAVHLLVSSEPRHFNVVVPILLIWIAFTLCTSLSLLKKSSR